MRTVNLRAAFRAAACVAAAALTIAVAGPAGAARPRPDRTPPTTPTNLRVTAVTHTSVALAWNPSTDNSSTFWYVVWAPGRSGVWSVNHPQTTLVATGLQPGRTYEFRVQAWDSAYNSSAASNHVSATTIADTTAPSVPADLSVLSVDQSKVLLRFTRGVDALGNTSHRVLVNGVASPNVASFLTPGTFPRPAQEQVWVRQLDPGGTYAIAVQAVDAFGNVSPPSGAVTVTTAPSGDVVAPTSPVLRRADSGGTGICPEEIWAGWTAATDDGPASEIEYEFRINGVINEVAAAFTQTIAYTEVGGANTVTVVAVDRAGNASAPSNAITVNVNWGSDCG
jgi:chitodextrinase